MTSLSIQELLSLDIALNKSVISALRKDCVKIETIINLCELIDRNKDGIIHKSDFIAVLQNAGVRSLSKAERNYLISCLKVSDDNDLIKYANLVDFEFASTSVQNEYEENWFDDVDNTPYPTNMGKNSLGDWINTRACPAEVE